MPCIIPPNFDLCTVTFRHSFFAPLLDLPPHAKCQRDCPELTDGQWLHLGVRRALEDQPSGRAFLQQLACRGVEAPELSHFFETLKSARRLSLIAEPFGPELKAEGLSHSLARSLPVLESDRWKCVPELAGFDLYAGDGHFHAAAAHDLRDAGDGVKYAVGHFFSLNLRTHALAHLSLADQIERKKEHDMRVLKRLSVETLRQGAARGRKVLWVWDRAGIDFRQWHHWKHTGGLYFLSREPSGAR